MTDKFENLDLKTYLTTSLDYIHTHLESEIAEKNLKIEKGKEALDGSFTIKEHQALIISLAQSYGGLGVIEAIQELIEKFDKIKDKYNKATLRISGTGRLQ